MKYLIATLGVLSLASGAVIAGEYDDPTQPETQQTSPSTTDEYTGYETESSATTGMQSEVDATTAVGKTVIDVEGEEVGEVESVVAGSAGQTDIVVVKAGGVAGIGEEELRIPLDELKPAADQLQALLGKDQLMEQYSVSDQLEEDEEAE